MDVNKKCDLIESLGFEIQHLDSRVEQCGLEFDFSSVASEKRAIVQAAITQAHAKGVAEGVEKTQKNIKNAIGI